MTRQFQRLTKRHANVLGILTGLAVISSILLSAGWRLTSNGAHIATVGLTHAASISVAPQSPDPFAPCVPAAANAIACENSKPGNPASQWDIVGAGNSNIQGFATDISVNRGETVRFKIDTNSNNYRLDIYRLGYYGGLGARLITTVQPSASLPQAQPACLTQPSTGLIDCGNWAQSASWAVPSNATSGIYIAKLVREDAVSGASHIVFIVRDDSGASDLLFQTSDTTWQAYNSYGGNSLYVGSPDGRAHKVSYNRPFNTREGETSHDWLFDGEYPMVRWLEANGYDVSYFTGVDTDRRGAELLEHKVFLSVGHDEYWSGTQRANVEAARNTGVHLAFFSGNTMFWKTRWENSIDGSGTQFRTLVSYKETHANAKIDPAPNVWTGTWRDPRFSPPADGGRPENALIGTIFTVNGPGNDAEIKAPEALGKFRFWRNTTVATQLPGQIATIGPGTVGYEWDEDLNNASRPSGLIRLSTNTVNVNSYLQDHGSTYAPGIATHSLTLYRHNSGALVFSAATIRWSWGLDDNHDQSEAPTIPAPDIRMRQATVNLLADMGVQPATLQPGLVAAIQSADILAPISTITSPIAGGTVVIGTTVNITGTASDAGGLVAGVNVSVNGGGAWSAATGTSAWSYNWTPAALGSVTIRSRAVDDSGNAQNPPAEITVTVVDPPQVVSVTPAPGATGVSTGAAPTATFSEPLDFTSLTTSTVLLRDAANNLVPVTISYSPSAFTVTLAPQQLQPGQTYTVTLKGGPAAPHITDSTGTPLASDFTWSFTTAPLSPLPPPLPILVITRSGNKFTQYYQEILRAEGFNNFNAIDMTQITDAVLAQHDVAILGEMSLSSTQVTMVSNWVVAGGNLIAMRPDKQLATLLGVSDAASVRSDAYLLVNTAQEPGAGIVNQTIQYHSAADLYTLAGATQVAAIYSSPTQSTPNPAVTLRSVGSNGGQAAAFTFDLARSIVFTRQGNPAWAGQERDGFDPIRPNDLFFGGDDPDPDHVNLDKVAIPQADELQRLLGNMILSMNADKRPLPRFWYLPNMKKAVILMTGDDHSTENGTKTIFDTLIAESAPGCSIANWECFRATGWLYTSSGLTNAQALGYHSQGFEIGVHVNTNCANWTPQTLESFFTNDLASFAAKYTSIPAQKTNRTHCLPWSDWATHPKVEFNHGIRLDGTYYYWPPSWVQNRPGFMTGSGFPMRYADLDGSIIDVYQAATHLVNETIRESGGSFSDWINSMLDKALDEGYYGVFGTHYDFNDDFQTQLLNVAKARNVSLISAQQLLTWLDGRNSSSFGNSTWNGTQLGFSISVGAGANNLFAMIPNQTPGGQLSSLTINGAPVAFTVETLKGRSYAVFRAANGNAVATYAP